MTLTRYSEADIDTVLDGAQYAEEPVTVEYPIGKSDAIWEAQPSARLEETSWTWGS